MIEEYRDVDFKNEKVIKIINTAYKEFAKYGKSKASLNNILKSSGISKGAFYYHFKDKESLFQFLLFHSSSKSTQDIEKQLDWDDRDVIRRTCNKTKAKLTLFKENPYMFEFADKFQKEIIGSLDEKYVENYKNKFYHQNIDFSKFKKQINVQEAIHIIRWTYKGIGFELLNDYDKEMNKVVMSELMDDTLVSEINDTCDRYYLILSSIFYK